MTKKTWILVFIIGMCVTSVVTDRDREKSLPQRPSAPGKSRQTTRREAWGPWSGDRGYKQIRVNDENDLINFPA
uniref:Uncharacterized protein n=1 Tax=Ciona intestinalis TaxID=7719 RepID=F6R1Y4_CIOIN